MELSCQWLVFHAFFAILYVASMMAQREAFTSFKSPKERIINYQTVYPFVDWTTYDSSYQLMVTLNSTTNCYTLKLCLNHGLLSPTFSSRYRDHTGKEDIQWGHENCFYHGEVVEEPEWTVVLSTCLGLRGSFGPRGDPALRYHIEPLHLGSVDLTQPHVLYLGSEYTTTSGTCATTYGTQGGPTPGTRGHGGMSKPQHRITSTRLRRQGHFAIVEWTLVNDNAQYLAFSSNLTHVVLRAIEIANGVDEVYRVEGVRVVVVDVITWTMGDPIEITTDSGDFLDIFRDYSPSLPQKYDSAMLFTGIEFDGTTIGIAYTATMCEYLRSSVGLVQDGGGQLEQLISTTAHELGHIFAMDHDTPSCMCMDISSTCIMEDTVGIPPATIWSSCSVETLHNTLEAVLCLDNEPSITSTDTACGNGIREEGEACDCGSVEECVDPCCNTTSCQLVAGAECRSGPCCKSDCQLRPYGSVCREKSNECDIEEYCTEESADCPRDHFVQNLSPCMNNESFCFSGHCQTRENQCQHHFNTGDAIDVCYTQVNTLGSVYGHCGFGDKEYLPCSERNAFCGQLQCRSDGELQTTPGFPVRYTLPSESFTCNSVTTAAGTDEISPGLIRDGTKCGDKMVCFNTECVNISAVGIPPCPVDSSREVCGGNGQCNGENQCSCSVGFKGQVCNEIVTGKGEDEEGGGRGQGRGNGGAIAGAVIAAVLVLAITGGVIAVSVLRLKSSQSSRSVHYRATSVNKATSNGRAPPPVRKPSQTHKTAAPAKPRPTVPPRPSAPPRPSLPAHLTSCPSVPAKPQLPTRSRAPERPPLPSRPPAVPRPLTKNNITHGGVKPIPAPRPVKSVHHSTLSK